MADFFSVDENLVGRMILRERGFWIGRRVHLDFSFVEDFVDVFSYGFEELWVCVQS